MESSLPKGPLTADRILESAQEVVRRHGPDKATVVDVAQALGVSHGSIYRFFPTKAALREAVVTRWLDSVVRDQEAEAARSVGEESPQRIRRWLASLAERRRQQRAQDPELFEAFRQLTAASPEPVRAFRSTLEAQLADLVADGIVQGALAPGEAATVAHLLLTATVKFHHPAFAASWDLPETTAEFDQLWAVLARGILPSRTLP